MERIIFQSERKVDRTRLYTIEYILTKIRLSVALDMLDSRGL